ncbi:TraB/GumN family protein [Notoacmeibacter sp. MSK16QG-6]|uniref:TraB/GumN family protein n=1 Tax=Notoacmeibacter sp. MSK16QG-6 TaxID=2957982 RepID=UPI0020A1F421|nr:TraB/GumN family protein [Notoacmeibacter sp. MSK16QG-6]MCP1199211.1 TraB/GumN family protein [Notoacmeibacter sp. MSK16QG-6]
MNATSSFLARLASPALIVVSLLHGLLFAGFAVSLLLIDPGSARAEEAARCQGRDLFAELKARDPKAAAKAEAAFEAMPNRRGRFWRIEKEGVSPSYLFGTIHTTDPRALALSGPVESAFEKASVFVMEAADTRSTIAATLAMARHPSLFLYTDGTSAFDQLSDEHGAAVKAALKRRGIDPSTATKLKPWLIAGMLAAPPCELQRKASGLVFLDNALADRAEEAGKDVEGLETMVDQMKALAAMPMESHIEGLANAAELDKYAADMTETLTIRYLSGDLGLIMPALQAIGEDIQGEPSEEELASVADFEEKVVTNRNRDMAEAAEPFLQTGNAFIAVGALHLPGDKGVVALLQQAGWKLTPVPLGVSQ